MIKPDPRLYGVAPTRKGRRADDVLFIGDRPPNIDAARALGFDVHYSTTLRP